MNHYTYLLQSKTDDMMYIGVRSCKCLPEEDNYWGSSKHLPKDVSDICDKFILGTFNSRKEALQDEINRHNINDVAKNPNFWNKAKQTSTGWDTTGVESWIKGKKHTQESKLKMSKSKKGICLSDDHKRKIGDAHKGKKVSLETKIKLSLAHKGKILSSEHRQKLSNSNLGNKHTEETKDKMSKSRKGIKFSKKHKENMSKNHYSKRVNYVSACKNKPQSKITCIHCGTIGGIPSMNRWHFNNCKHKENR